MRKLTDEELSMVLSQHAAGHLQHVRFRGFVDSDCGCVAGVVCDLDPGTMLWEASSEALEISNSIDRAQGVGTGEARYPRSPERLLDLLAKAGL